MGTAPFTDGPPGRRGGAQVNVTSGRLAERSGTAAVKPAAPSERYLRLVVLHFLVGALLFLVPVLATPFAALVVLRALWLGIESRRVDDLVTAIGYVVGSEVLLRMTGARVPWEAGKYLVVILAACAVARLVRGPFSLLPVTYFALLLPAAAVTITAMELPEAREAFASYLLGPLSLAAVALVCLRLSADRESLARLLWAIILPVVTMATYMLLTFVTTANVTFTDESNNLASGNFGPNQVATALSAGMLAAFLLLVVVGERGNRALLIGLSIWFLTASLLTFSRGGLVSFGVAAFLATTQMVTDLRRLVRLLAVGLVALVMLMSVIVPRLDDLTGGKLSARFSDTDTAHRSSIADGDWEVFLDNPVIGVGIGQSPLARTSDDAGRSAHVEYSRLISEHGAFGLVALLLLAAMVLRRLVRRGGARARAWSLAMMSWSLVTMAHADMRLAAVGALFGLGCLTTHLVDKRPVSSGRVQVT